MTNSILEKLSPHAIPGRVTMVSGNGNLPKIVATSDHGTAEIYLHGAQVTHFQKNGEAPLLFLSQSSHFIEGKAIRGGVPIVFPWFGSRAGAAAHGFARTTNWELSQTALTETGGVKLVFQLLEAVAKNNNITAKVSYVVTVSDQLTMELVVTNASATETLGFEACLHTYFAVGDIAAVSITGLQGHSYLDSTDNFTRKLESAPAIQIDSEVDRIYLDSTGRVEIQDPKLRRKIRVEKSGSASTVVWNPWVNKSKQMADFGDDEFRQMVCVESGSVAQNKIQLAPGKSATLKVTLDSQPV